jgi:hypothetical protein
VDGELRAAVLGEDPPLLRVRLADVDGEETHAVAEPFSQPVQRPDLGAEGGSSVGAEDESDRPPLEQRG